MLSRCNILGIPYKSFKQKIRLTKQYIKSYTVEDLGGVLYMKKRGTK